MLKVARSCRQTVSNESHCLCTMRTLCFNKNPNKINSCTCICTAVFLLVYDFLFDRTFVFPFNFRENNYEMDNCQCLLVFCTLFVSSFVTAKDLAVKITSTLGSIEVKHENKDGKMTEIIIMCNQDQKYHQQGLCAYFKKIPAFLHPTNGSVCTSLG